MVVMVMVVKVAVVVVLLCKRRIFLWGAGDSHGPAVPKNALNLWLFGLNLSGTMN